MSINVFLSDDHAMFREGIRLLLETEPEIKVVGEAGNGRETIRQVAKLRPDIALVDIAMPDLNGIETTGQIGEVSPSTKVIILSMYSTTQHVFRAFKAGARGYILKGSGGRDVIKAIKAVYMNKCYLCDDISKDVMDDYIKSREMLPNQDPIACLNQREREVLQLLVEGKSNVKIAEILCLSHKTVETYRSRLMQKLGIDNLPSLVKFAIQNGLTSL